MSRDRDRRAALLTLLVLTALPLAILWPALRPGAALVPFDHRVFAPDSFALDAPTLAELHATANFDITEKTLVNAPEIRFATDEVRAGRGPWWNPFARCGAPLFATTISGLASPAHLPHWLMPPEQAFVWTAWLGLVVAGALMLGLLRELRLGWPAALFGAVVFAWSGTMAARLHLFPHYGTLAWLPGSLWALERLRRPEHDGWRAAAALAGCTAMTWTAGYPPAAVASSLVTGAWLLLRVGTARAQRWRGLGRGTSGLLLGLGLAAFALAPMTAYFLATGRTDEPELMQLRLSRTLDPCEWLDLVWSAPFGTPALNRDGGIPHNKAPLLWLLHSRADAEGVEPLLKFTEHRLYLGALPILLVPWSLAHRARAVAVLVLAGTAALLAGAAGGGATFAWLSTMLPPLRFLQPMELMPPVAALLAIAAALGFDRLLGPNAARGRRATVVLALGLGVGSAALTGTLAALDEQTLQDAFFAGLHHRWPQLAAAAGDEASRAFFAPVLTPARDQLIASGTWAAVWFSVAAGCAAAAQRWPRTARSAAIAATALELLLCAAPFIPSHAAAAPPEAGAAVRTWLRDERDRHAAAGGFTVARVAAGPAPETPLALPPNLLLPERIRDLNAYTFIDGRSHQPFGQLYADSSPALLVRGRWFNAFPDDARLAHPLFDLLAVRFLLCHIGADQPPPQHAGIERCRVDAPSGASFRVYERPSAGPRAFVVPRLQRLANDDAVLAAITDDEFAPRRVALITEADAQPLGARSTGAVPSGPDGGTVEFVQDAPCHMTLAIRGSDGGYLVLADTWLPGWSAEVDGQPRPVLRVNGFLRAVPVPAGTVRVELRYAPPGGAVGGVLSVIAVVLTVWLCARRRADRQPAAPATNSAAAGTPG
ncbi:MAG: hypothetical protein AAF628_33910 [Planctomycetota bacterium]